MDINKLKAIAGKIKEEKDAQKGTGEWPQTVFLPEGVHKGRFIYDPNQDLFEKYAHYGFFASGFRAPEDLPDDVLPEGFDKENHPLREITEELAERLHFKFGRKFSFITYFQLVSTDSPSDDWKPGTLYCIVANNKFANAFTHMITSLAEDSPEQLLNSLSPDKKGPLMEIVFERGAQGKASISPTFVMAEPVLARTENEEDAAYAERLGKLGYKPLAVSFIKPGFDKEKYENLLKRAKEALDEKLGNKPAESSGDQAKEGAAADSAGDKPKDEANAAQQADKDKPSEAQQQTETKQSKDTEKPAAETKQPASEPPPPAASDDPFAKFRKNQ